MARNKYNYSRQKLPQTMHKLEDGAIATPPSSRQKEVTLRRESSKNQRTLLGFFKKKGDVSSSPAPQSSPVYAAVNGDVDDDEGKENKVGKRDGMTCIAVACFRKRGFAYRCF